MEQQERRKGGDRRRNRNDQPKNHKLLVVGLGLAFALAGYLAVMGTLSNADSQIAEAKSNGDSNSGSSSKASRRVKDYEAYRQKVLAADQDLLDKYRERKADRKNDAEVTDPEDFNDKRISQIENALETEKFLQSNKKGSLGWQARKTLEKISADRPQ